MAITCCKGCMPPERSPTCHCTCTKYAEQKAKHDADLEQTNKAKLTDYNLYHQRGERVAKAIKRKR
jgi:hypothetical protein